MNFLDTLLDGSLMPHGHCLLWRWDLLFLHAGGDVLTVASYFAIPPALLMIRNKRPDLGLERIIGLFAAFIFLCGLSHLAGLVNIWQGFYFIEGLTKFGTGLVSALTLLVVWKQLPNVLNIPTTDALITNKAVYEQSKADLTKIKTEIDLATLELLQRKEELEQVTTLLYAPSKPTN